MPERSVIVHASLFAFVVVASLATGSPAAAEPVAKARAIDDVLSTCRVDDKTKKCAVTPEDAEEICRAMTPTAALRAFLGHGKKLRLGYLTRDMEAWSTTRTRATKTRARFDEEVMVLSQRRTKSSVVVSGAAVTFEVLRWDGTCASLAGEEITFKPAPQPVRPIQLAHLYLPTQTKLLEDARIQAATERADVACRTGAETLACDMAKRAFGATLVARGPRLAL